MRELTIRGRIIIFSMFMRISPGNASSITVEGVSCWLRRMKPSSAPRSTEPIVAERRRLVFSQCSRIVMMMSLAGLLLQVSRGWSRRVLLVVMESIIGGAL